MNDVFTIWARKESSSTCRIANFESFKIVIAFLFMIDRLLGERCGIQDVNYIIAKDRNSMIQEVLPPYLDQSQKPVSVSTDGLYFLSFAITYVIGIACYR